jgi:hypothetical protein
MENEPFSDVPSVDDQSWRYFVHWAVVNIPMPLINYSEHKTPVYLSFQLAILGMSSTAQMLLAAHRKIHLWWISTGAYRYQFLLFWQSARISEKQLVETFSGGRQKFDPEVLKFNLKMSFTASTSFKCGH